MSSHKTPQGTTGSNPSTLADARALPLPLPISTEAPPAGSSPTPEGSPILVLPRVQPASVKRGERGFIVPGDLGERGGRGRRNIRVLGTPGPSTSGNPGTAVNNSEGQLVLSGSSHVHRDGVDGGAGQPPGEGPTTTTNYQELAVVPFTPPRPLQDGVMDDPGGPLERALVAAVDSSQWALSTRRVCPTCLRPYGSDDEDIEDDEDELLMHSDADSGMNANEEEAGAGGGRYTRRGRRRTRSQSARPRSNGTAVRAHSGRRPTSFRRLLSPQYFRALEAAQPLAIGDGSEGHAQSSPLPPPGTRRPSDTSPRPHPPPQPTYSYVSPNGSVDHATYDFPDVGLDPTHSLGVEWTGDESTNPPDVRTTIPFRVTSALHTYPSAQKPAPTQGLGTEEEDDKAYHAQREQARRDNEAMHTQSPLVGMNGYYARYFVEVQKLGSGTYGGVYLCQHVMEGVPLGTFALKKVPVGDKAEYLQKVLSEVRILEEVKRHPNVVEYNHSWVEEAQLADFGPPVRCLFILMEYATEGSLDAYLERYGTALSTVAVWYFFLSAVAGTAHLHQKNILHRDLKPQNLLLTGPPGKPPRVLVSDFGTAALLGENSYDRTGGTGTLEYMAPELMEVVPNLAEERYVNRHTKASDVWSLGMILYYLACNATLPAQLPGGSVALSNLQSHSPFTRPPEMVELIRAMLQRDPRRRPSCHEILSSTVVQTILRSFNSAAAATATAATTGGSGEAFNVITRDIMPCDDPGSGIPSPPRMASPTSRRVRPFATHGRSESLDVTPEMTEEEDGLAEPPSPPALRYRSTTTAPGGTDASREASPTSGKQELMESSRVELMSTTVNASTHNLMEVPLLMQYRANDAATRGASGGSSRSPLPTGGRASPIPVVPYPRSPQKRGPRDVSPNSGGSPLAKRPRMVDAQVQTDPVNIVD